jgi:anion transporter
MIQRLPSFIAVLCLLAAAAMVAASVFVLPPDANPHLWRAAGVVLGALGLWATGLLPEAVTSVAFFLAVILLGIGDPSVAFAGFHAAALWLVFGGMLIGLSVKSTGLGERLARGLVGRMGESYLAVLGGVTLVAMALAFVMPSSTGRVMLMMPVVLSLCDHLGYPHGGRGRTGLALLTGMMCFNPPTAVLPAVVPNMVMMGAAESQYGIHFQYLPWLLAHFPTTGLLKALVIMAACWAMFRQAATPRNTEQTAPLPPLSADEKRLLLLLSVTLGLWATDSLHGISPAWVAMAAGLACLMPGLGKREPLISMAAFQKGVNFPFLLHVAGLLSLGTVVAQSGLGQALGGWLIEHLPLSVGNTVGNFFALASMSALTGMATTIPGVPAVLTPLAGSLAQASGWPITTILMIQVVGYSTVFLPYQVPPLIVAMHMGGIAPGQGARLTLTICAIAVLLIWPLTMVWWMVLNIL